MVDLHGVTILRVEMGSFSDMTLEPTSISGSLALVTTAVLLVMLSRIGSRCGPTLIQHRLPGDDIAVLYTLGQFFDGKLLYHVYKEVELL
jgi:hypothetical protein